MVIGSTQLSRNISLFLNASSHWSEDLSSVTILSERDKYKLHHQCFWNALMLLLFHFIVCSKGGLLLCMPFRTTDGQISGINGIFENAFTFLIVVASP